jgi:hypothetical protein
MRTLLVVLFALVVSCSALAAAPEAEASTRSAINLAQSAPAAAPAGAAAPAKPFYDPLLMYNPYMWMYWNPYMWMYWNPMMWMYYPYMMWW